MKINKVKHKILPLWLSSAIMNRQRRIDILLYPYKNGRYKILKFKYGYLVYYKEKQKNDK